MELEITNIKVGVHRKESQMSEQQSSDPNDVTPRWVKVFGIIFLVLVVLFVILHLAGGGFQGHMS